jgi:lipoate-protein ligase A
MSVFRLLVDPPRSGAWNMAVDETLLESAATEGVMTWRFYQWETPTLSLGYFQACSDRSSHEASGNCPLVRRASGGGAIVHDRELTYSCAIPAIHPLAVRRDTLYTAVHQVLIATLAEFGVNAQLCGGGCKPAVSPFLCFQRRSGGDILVDRDKVGGSAQRRLQGAVLQHGSLLLGRSPAAPELPGVLELSGRSMAIESLIPAWHARLEKTWQIAFETGELTASERVRSAHWVASKYGSDDWNLRRRR